MSASTIQHFPAMSAVCARDTESGDTGAVAFADLDEGGAPIVRIAVRPTVGGRSRTELARRVAYALNRVEGISTEQLAEEARQKGDRDRG